MYVDVYFTVEIIEEKKIFLRNILKNIEKIKVNIFLLGYIYIHSYDFFLFSKVKIIFCPNCYKVVLCQKNKKLKLSSK